MKWRDLHTLFNYNDSNNDDIGWCVMATKDIDIDAIIFLYLNTKYKLI